MLAPPELRISVDLPVVALPNFFTLLQVFFLLRIIWENAQIIQNRKFFHRETVMNGKTHFQKISLMPHRLEVVVSRRNQPSIPL